MVHVSAKNLNEVTQAAKAQKYAERLESIQDEMAVAAARGDTFVFWDKNIYGPLSTVDRADFVNAGFEVIEVNEGVTHGSKIDWER